MVLLPGEHIGGPEGFEQLRKLDIGAGGPVSELSPELLVLEVPVAAAVPVFLVPVAVVAAVSCGRSTSMVVAFPPMVVSKRAAVGAEVEVVPVVVPVRCQLKFVLARLYQPPKGEMKYGMSCKQSQHVKNESQDVSQRRTIAVERITYLV
jgi:hypothetical protein